MSLVAEIITSDADDARDVIWEAESILIQALFDDLVSAIPPTRLTTHTPARPSGFRQPSLRAQIPVRGGGRAYAVVPWARSPPGMSHFSNTDHQST